MKKDEKRKRFSHGGLAGKRRVSVKREMINLFLKPINKMKPIITTKKWNLYILLFLLFVFYGLFMLFDCSVRDESRNEGVGKRKKDKTKTEERKKQKFCTQH